MSVERFLRQPAVNIVCEGSLTLHRWYDPNGKLRTLACRTTRVSPFRMIVRHDDDSGEPMPMAAAS